MKPVQLSVPTEFPEPVSMPSYRWDIVLESMAVMNGVLKKSEMIIKPDNSV